MPAQYEDNVFVNCPFDLRERAPIIGKKLNIKIRELTFVDLTHVITEWLKGHSI
jgi:hypothetical protein